MGLWGESSLAFGWASAGELRFKGLISLANCSGPFKGSFQASIRETRLLSRRSFTSITQKRVVEINRTQKTGTFADLKRCLISVTGTFKKRVLRLNLNV